MRKNCPVFKIFHKLSLTILALFCFLQSYGMALAATDLSLTATPVRLGDDYSIKLKPGEKKQVQVKVRNGSTDTLEIESKALDFVVAEDGFSPLFVDAKEADPRWSLASWLTLVPNEHKLANEEVGTVNVLIEVPKNALPGGHYAMVYHRPLASTALTESGSGIAQRVGTLLYVVVDGPINEEAYISKFHWPKFLENGPVNFSLQIDNQSDVHISPQPILKIYNLFGKEVAKIDLEARNIFPKTQREFSGTWNKIWGLGYYKAIVEASYGSEGRMLSAAAGLYLVPVKLILLILIIILLGIILTLTIKKRRQHQDTAAKSDLDLETQHEETDDGAAKN